MNKTFIILSIIIHFFFFLISQPAWTQANQLPNEVTNLFKINFFLPGLSYEQKLFHQTTLNMDAYMDGLYINEYESATNHFHIYFTPAFKTEGRIYYNLERRSIKGLRTALNSANYIAPLYVGRYSITSEFSDHKWISQLGAVWGIQRNNPGRFSFDFNTGLVTTFNAKNYTFYHNIQPVLQIRLGCWIGRNQK